MKEFYLELGTLDMKTFCFMDIFLEKQTRERERQRIASETQVCHLASHGDRVTRTGTLSMDQGKQPMTNKLAEWMLPSLG